jgi:3-hydroxy acid dehydrogenase/malonic semialdehyde reductase
MTKAIVWGANSDIGRAAIQMLDSKGWQVVAFARDETTVSDLPATIIEVNDVADEFAVQTAVREAAYEIEEANLWLYTVGDITAVPVGDMDLAAWTTILNANLTGAYLTLHHSLPLLAEKSHLMFVGAIHERLRLPGLSAYAAAKAGLDAFAETVKKEERRKKVTVVRPGAVATKFWDNVPMKMPKDAMAPEKLASKIWEAYETGHKGQLDLTH